MIIFLCGEDSFRSLEKLREIKEKFLEKSGSSIDSGYFDFSENKSIDFLEIKKAFGSKGLFFQKQLVIIKNIMTFASKDIVLKTVDLLKKQKDIFDDKDLVVVFWEKGKINEKNELFKFLKDKTFLPSGMVKSQNFDLLSGARLLSWIEFETKKENERVKFSQKSAEKLVAYTGGDLLVLKNEIKKLANFKEEGVIGEEDVEILVKEKISANIFETIEALLGGDKKTALGLFQRQIQSGEDPFYVFSMYTYQLRNFLKVSEYYEKGSIGLNEISRKTKIHPFVVKKILGQISRFSVERLKKMYKKLQTIDEKVKTGKGEIKMEIEKLIVEI